MMTTRLLGVATSLGCQNPYFINLLDVHRSWKLLCQTIFAKDSCPLPELEDIGKDIAKNCRGLPLAIVVIGGQLAKSNMTREYWEIVSKNTYAQGNLGDNEHCLKVLSQSYNTLPISLKPCFLYLRVFPEDAEIEISRLIKLWVDEGFIKQKGDKSLEDVAKEYVNDLIDRNLLFIRERWNWGNSLLCGIHDLLRELCIRESDNENFLLIPKVQHIRIKGGVLVRSLRPCYCSYCSAPMVKEKFVNIPEIVLIPSSKSKFNPNVCDACRTMYSHIGSLQLVRAIHFDSFDNVVQSTGLRHINIKVQDIKVPNLPLFSALWNLHTLVLHYRKSNRPLPTEIWDMTQLRCVQVSDVPLPHPIVRYVEGTKDIMVMKDLQVLSTVCLSITDDVLARIQNLKTLELICPGRRVMRHHRKKKCYCYSLTKLAQLDKLEVFIVRNCFVKNISFPNSLKKLYLDHLENPSKAIPIIGSLPNLEELELYEPNDFFEWSPVEGQFLLLKGLFLESKCLKHWEAEQSHFPVLKWLKLSRCDNLKEIPLAIGDIPTLRSIDLFRCSESSFESAKQLWEEQESYGNEGLQLHVTDQNYEEHQFGVVQPMYLSFTKSAYLM